MKRLLLALSLLMSVTAAHAQWKQIGVQVQGAKAYIDSSTIEKTGDTSKVLVMLDFKKPETHNTKKPYSSITYLWEFNCAQSKRRPLAINRYSGNKASGTVVQSTPENPEWQFVYPHTIYSAAQEIACAK